MTDLFNTPPGPDSTPTVDETVNHLDALVGEGKKFKDAAALAKGKAESDAFIGRLQSELDGMRSELNTRISLQEFMDKIESTRNANPPVEPNHGSDAAVGKESALTPEQIAQLVKQTLSQEQQVSSAKRNVDYVKAELEKSWGNNFSKQLNDKAKELGASTEFLGKIAETNPKAFLRLVGAEVTTPRAIDSGAPPRTSVNSAATPMDTGTKTYSSYEKLRKENPRQYWSREVQSEIHRIAQEKGEAFFR